MRVRPGPRISSTRSSSGPGSRPWREPMATPSAESVPLPPPAALIRGVQGFILCSAIGIALGFLWQRPAGWEAVARGIRWEVAALLPPLIALDHLLGGLRYRIFFNGEVLPRVSLWNCMRSNWAN